jgi:Histidine kinase-, DNA gyrase B-, and HSP90-like ATPase
VLSGADPGRHWAQRMTLVDVVRAAAAEVEEYQRVEFLPTADLHVTGHASVDVIHLLAELIENATAFSPPNTKVQIAGQAVPHGYVVEIEDRGLGMSDEELIQANERLANPPEIDFALSRVLGLYVVGRLGQRHGIKVQLRHSWYGGVTALTLLPHGLLVWPKVPQVLAAEPAGARIVEGRAELPPPERPAVPEPGPPGGSTPIFEAARSDWFVAEPPEPPHRLHRGPASDGNGLGRAGDRQPSQPAGPPSPPPVVPPEEPAYRPSRVPPPSPPVPPTPAGAAADEPAPSQPEPVHAADEQPPLSRVERARLRGDTPPPFQVAQPPPTPVPPEEPHASRAAPVAGSRQGPEGGERLTQAGLPRRVPRANLAPGMVASQEAPADQPESVQASGRTPEEVRSMLASYRTGIERGRTVAGGADPAERPPDTP